MKRRHSDSALYSVVFNNIISIVSFFFIRPASNIQNLEIDPNRKLPFNGVTLNNSINDNDDIILHLYRGNIEYLHVIGYAYLAFSFVLMVQNEKSLKLIPKQYSCRWLINNEPKFVFIGINNVFWYEIRESSNSRQQS